VGASGQQRQLNIQRIYTAIREDLGTNRAELSRRFGLSKPTVSEITRILIDANLVAEGRPQRTGGRGRHPIGLVAVPDAYHILAITLGGTNLRGAIVNLSGHIKHHESEKADGPRLEEQAEQLIRRLLERVEGPPVLGIGVGAAGTVDQATGRILNMPAHGRRNVDLPSYLTGKIGLPVLVDNDVNYGAIGEWWRGAAKQERNTICISIGTGIGAGLILDGKLFRGSRNLVGEIGYFYHRVALPEAPLTSFGGFEHQASGWGICQRAEEALREGAATLLTAEHLAGDQARAVFDAAARGDEVCRTIVDRAVHEIGIAVANTISLLDLDSVVLTGGLIGAHKEILEDIERIVHRVAVPESRDLVDIRLGSLGKEAVFLGAAYEVQETLLPELVARQNPAR